ncbi:MAG: phenylalanine--tRNA ligase subunit beta [Clostridia bacterium]|jgi:phenylalanyl-tRNA synthetase beta chain|nr:phenylalanine--tRNA ligase subunit beta [Clostridia bacterium]
MIVPFSWLKDYVDIDISAEELQEKLFSCGFEVEELTYLGKDVTGVAVGEILSCEKHPDADRLTVCKVNCGAYGEKQICTAATNVFVGAKVPCALDGATVLHEGGVQKIKTGKLRGVLSDGMFCSGEELGINDDYYEGAEVNGILILDASVTAGEDIRKIVGIDDYLFDIAVTANRPDCQSIFGMAREVAAVLKKPLRAPETSYTPVNTQVKIPVSVEELALCPRYVGHYVADVVIGKSPQWLRRRLALCGLRSVSDIVDITNFVLLELGQPMHAFDRNFLQGGKIVVRRAKQGEKIVTLDEKEFTLSRENLLICDGERGVALAGIMGGLNSEIKAETREVFFEAAKFARDSVRKTSRALGQRSDSSARFEKGIDAYTCAFAMDRALHLTQKLGCGKPTCYRADTAADPAPKTIRTSFEKINALLGIEVPQEEVVAILNRLFFTTAVKGGELTVTVPLWREDVDGYPDLAEEVIRMYGYEHIKPTFLQNATVTHGGLTTAQKQESKCKNILKEEGYFEALNYSFYSPKDFDLMRLSASAPERKAVKILNPIGEDLSVMRTFLAPSMLGNIVRNVRRGNDSGKLFELANVYRAEELPLRELPEERKHLVLGIWGEGDFFDLKGAVEAFAQAFELKLKFAAGERPFLHPGITAIVYAGEKEAGYLGELHPEIAEELALEKKVCLAELDYTLLEKKFAKDIRYHHLPKFPDVQRDLAVVVKEEVTCAELEDCILRACKAVKRAELFDVYRSAQVGAGKKSVAFRLTFSPEEKAEKPLTPETTEAFFRKIVGNLGHNLGAELR